MGSPATVDQPYVVVVSAMDDIAFVDDADLTNAARNMEQLLLSEDDVRKPIGVRPMLQAEIAEVRSGYPAAEIPLEGQIPDVAVLADDMLDAVFGNLLQNAIQHNESETPRVTVTAVRREDVRRLSIADNGPGIPDERKQAIFGEGENGLETAGTGLGLYLVDSLVEVYDGAVWAEDIDPIGSVFHVDLPIAE